MIAKLGLYIALMLAAPLAAAGSVVCTPGQLHSLLEKPAEVAELAISGSINAADLAFMASEMPSLRSLSLAEANIRTYDGPAILGASHHPANSIPAFVFVNSPLEAIALPPGPLTIGDAAFAGAALREIELGRDILSIGHGAFMGCHELASASIACPVDGDGVFTDCTALSRVALSDNATTIGHSAFKGCTSLASLDCDAELASIGPLAFAGSAISTLRLPGSVTSLGHLALASMPSLSVLDSPGVTTIGEGALLQCPRLETATFSSRLSIIDDYALAMAVSLKTIDLGETTRIGDFALSHAALLTGMTLPAQLSKIGSHAMEHTTSLDIIDASAAAPPAVDVDAWHGINQSEVTLIVADGNLDDYSNAPQWKEFNIVAQSALGVGDLGLSALGKPRATFNGPTLSIEGRGNTISMVSVYNQAAQVLLAATPAADRFSTDTSQFSDKIYIVVVTTTDQCTTTFKLIRN